MFIGTFSSYNSSIVIFFVHFYFTEDMPAQIFFKFKSQLKFDSIPFDGLSISAKEVRRSIVAKPARANVRLIMLLTIVCLACRPALFRHERP